MYIIFLKIYFGQSYLLPTVPAVTLFLPILFQSLSMVIPNFTAL